MWTGEREREIVEILESIMEKGGLWLWGFVNL